MSLRRPLFPMLALVLAAFLCPSCAETGEDAWQPPRIVRIDGAEIAHSFSPMYGTIFGKAVVKDGPGESPLKPLETTTYALTRPGDLLAVNEGPPFPFAAGDGASLSVTFEEDRVVLEGNVVAIKPAGSESQTWLMKAPEAELAALRLIDLAGPGWDGEADDADAAIEDGRKVLARLAEVNPDVAVLVGGGKALALVLEMFDPGWLSVDGVVPDADLQDLLAAEPNLHMLVMKGQAENGLAFLSRLPHLQTLILSDWEAGGEDAPGQALPTMPALRTLLLLGPEIKDLGPIGTQPNLVELAVITGKDLEDVGRLAEMPGLRTLSLQGCEKAKDLEPLSAVEHLRWLVLPPKTTQAQFAAVCKDHPDLEVLQAVPCMNIKDLAPLANLRRLRVLTLGETAAPLDPVAGLASLRLLGVDLKHPEPKEGEAAAGEGKAEEGDAEETQARKARHQAVVRIMDANPDLAVVQVSPLCLGSGWILLLVPAAAGAWWMARRRRSGAAGDDG